MFLRPWSDLKKNLTDETESYFTTTTTNPNKTTSQILLYPLFCFVFFIFCFLIKLSATRRPRRFFFYIISLTALHLASFSNTFEYGSFNPINNSKKRLVSDTIAITIISDYIFSIFQKLSRTTSNLIVTF